MANIIGHNSGYDLKYILGIFNSKLINIWYKFHYPNVNVNPNDFRQITIKEASLKEQEPIIKLVDNIIKITGKKSFVNNSLEQSKVDVLINQIDNLIYELYNLNDKEIELVENFYND